jgi:hypothetical protein
VIYRVLQEESALLRDKVPLDKQQQPYNESDYQRSNGSVQNVVSVHNNCCVDWRMLNEIYSI